VHVWVGSGEQWQFVTGLPGILILISTFGTLHWNVLKQGVFSRNKTIDQHGNLDI